MALIRASVRDPLLSDIPTAQLVGTARWSDFLLPVPAIVSIAVAGDGLAVAPIQASGPILTSIDVAGSASTLQPASGSVLLDVFGNQAPAVLTAIGLCSANLDLAGAAVPTVNVLATVNPVCLGISVSAAMRLWATASAQTLLDIVGNAEGFSWTMGVSAPPPRLSRMRF